MRACRNEKKYVVQFIKLKLGGACYESCKEVLRFVLAGFRVGRRGCIYPEHGSRGLTYSGNFVPADPSTWTSTTAAHVASSANAAVTVDGGYHFATKSCYITNSSGKTGTVTVTGAGSTWAVTGQLSVGSPSTTTATLSTLTITNGGSVSSDSGGWTGYIVGASATVDGAGS